MVAHNKIYNTEKETSKTNYGIIIVIIKDRPKPVNAFSAENETENESRYFQLFFKSKSCMHY